MKLLPMLLLALAAGAPPLQDGKTPKPTKTPLKAATFNKGQFRPGYGIQADPPLKGWKATVGGEPFIFFDLDGDGVLAVEKDGLAIPTAPFVVPIPDVLLTRGGQFEIAFDGTTHLSLTRQDLGKWQALVSDMALMTTLRIQAGVRPAMFSALASSHCELHCDYLNLNGETDGSTGMGLHKEDPKKKGYTPEGAAAAAGSNLGAKSDDPKSALMSWYQSVWHRVHMVGSHLKSFGFALKHGVAMLYFFQRTAPGDRPQCHPADGATGVLTSFSVRGERPNPVPKSDYGRGSGFPILLLLRGEPGELEAAKLTDAAGRLVEGTQSCPINPANRDWPHNSGCAVFVPSKPLAPNMTYKARFEFKGLDKPTEWSFTTGR